MLLVFGAISIDFIFPVPALPRPGDNAWSEGGWFETGGKGAIEAVAAARDGTRVTLVGAVGNDFFGDTAVSDLSRSGLNIRNVAQVTANTGRAAVCVQPDGKTTATTMLGANRLAKAVQVDDALLNDSNALLLQLATDPEECAALAARARHAGVPVILHVSPPFTVSAEILRATNVLIGNSREIACLGERLGTGSNPASIHAALEVATVRMLGPQGADAMSPNGYVHMSALPVDVCDTTAADECFTGVLASALSQGKPLEIAMQRAATAAALSTQRIGGQSSIPTRQETNEALKRAPKPTCRQPQIAD
jgi:ribokinase